MELLIIFQEGERLKPTGSMAWLGRQRERRILALCKKHLDKVVETVDGMRKTILVFDGLDPKKIKKAFKDVFDGEREADDLKKKILDEISKGIFHPINRGEIIRLVLTADEIAANAKAASRKLNYIPARSLDGALRKMLKEFSKDLLKTARLTNGSFEMLIKDPPKALALTEAVEDMEEKIDDFRVEKMMPEVLNFFDCSSKKPSTSLVFKEVIDNMELVADRCEDVADIIRELAVASP